MNDSNKVRISHFGTHYHHPDCRAANPDITKVPGKFYATEYYDIDVRELKQAKNDRGRGFSPCGMCDAERYVKSIASKLKR